MFSFFLSLLEKSKRLKSYVFGLAKIMNTRKEDTGKSFERYQTSLDVPKKIQCNQGLRKSPPNAPIEGHFTFPKAF